MASKHCESELKTRLLIYLKLLRPTQWLKNFMLFFPPFLGGSLFNDRTIIKGALPFAAFCFGASAAYIFNDIIDRENDTHHPQKKYRPLAAGRIPVVKAGALCFLLFIVSLTIGHLVSPTFFLVLLLYLAISAFYSLKLKEIPVVDLFCISAGFLLRLQGGGEAFGIRISEWLFLSVFLLSLFLSTGKRLGEMKFLGNTAGHHRKSLLSYPESFLDGLLSMTGAAVLVTYTMYVITRHALVYSVLLCCFGLLRFIFRVKTGLGGDPTDSLLKDGQLFTVSFLWLVMVSWIIYR